MISSCDALRSTLFSGLYDLMQQLPLHGVGRAVIDLLAVTPALKKPVLGERAQMVRYGGAGHVHHGRDVHHALLTVAQQPENADTVGVPQLAENIRDILKMRPVSEQLLHGRRVVLFLPVVVRQAGMFHLFSSFSPVRKWFSPLWASSLRHH